jgi:putative salt-induced outer membrane protein YdiY
MNAALAAQEARPKPLRFSGDIGFVNTSGNSEVTTLNVGERIDYTAGRLGLAQTLGTVYGRTAGVTNTSLWRSSVRADYAATKRLGGYGRVGFERNRFAGIARRLDEGVGLAYRLLQLTRDTLTAEAGGSLVQQRSTLGVSDAFAAARGAATYRHQFTGKAYFLQLVEALQNLETSDDVLVNTESSLVAPLSSSVALKLSYVVRFDNRPEPGLKKSDRIFTSGVQVTF